MLDVLLVIRFFVHSDVVYPVRTLDAQLGHWKPNKDTGCPVRTLEAQ